MRERSAGDQGRIHTGPPDTGKVLKETYNNRSNIGEKRYHPVNRNITPLVHLSPRLKNDRLPSQKATKMFCLHRCGPPAPG